MKRCVQVLMCSAIALADDVKSEDHRTKAEEQLQGGSSKQYMKQYVDDDQKYMKQGGQGGKQSQGADYEHYMKQYAGDYQKYMKRGGKDKQQSQDDSDASKQ